MKFDYGAGGLTWSQMLLLLLLSLFSVIFTSPYYVFNEVGRLDERMVGRSASRSVDRSVSVN